MIQLRTILDVADNTGAKKASFINVVGRKNSFIAHIGDVVTVNVKESAPEASVKKGEVAKAVVVRTKRGMRRPDGSYIRFDDNAVVILEKGKKDPKAGRVFGPIPRELAEKGFQKIISLAQEVI